MLTKTIVEDILELRLPEQNIIEHLEKLTSEQLDVQTIRLFIEVLEATLDKDSAELGCYEGAIDTCGTGGSGRPHFNTSTAVSFVLAAGGLKVAKFGNRAAQSNSGSFDFLDVLNIPSYTPTACIPELLDTVGIAFLFAPQFYPGLAKLAPIRKSLAKRTIFNSIGPLLNPIKPNYRLMGVSCPRAQLAVGEYLSTVKTNRRALIVHAKAGLDELDPYTENTVVDSMVGYVYITTLKNLPAVRTADGAWNPNDPIQTETAAARNELAQADMERYRFTPAENVALFEEAIRGKGPQWLTDLICINAAAGFVANCSSSLDACYDMALELIKSGAVAEKFEECKSAYAKLAVR